MKVDLLVVNYKTKNLLQRLLETLNSDYQPNVWNLYVADNGSDDGSIEWIHEHAEEYRIDHVFQFPNIGYARAINALSAAGTNELLCALNSDVWFSTNHVIQAIDSFKQNPNQAIMGPKQVDEASKIRHGGIFWDGNKMFPPIHRGWAQPDLDDSKFKDRIRCWTVSGSIYYIRRSVWNEMLSCPIFNEQIAPNTIGSFLPTDLYFEETFLSVHAGYHGFEIWYDGTIETCGHSWSASVSPNDQKLREFFLKSSAFYRAACDAHGINHELN